MTAEIIYSTLSDEGFARISFTSCILYCSNTPIVHRTTGRSESCLTICTFQRYISQPQCCHGQEARDHSTAGSFTICKYNEIDVNSSDIADKQNFHQRVKYVHNFVEMLGKEVIPYDQMDNRRTYSTYVKWAYIVIENSLGNGPYKCRFHLTGLWDRRGRNRTRNGPMLLIHILKIHKQRSYVFSNHPSDRGTFVSLLTFCSAFLVTEHVQGKRSERIVRIANNACNLYQYTKMCL